MHSFNSCLMHCVFSTKERRPFLTPAIRERLWPYLGGIARENDMKARDVGLNLFRPYGTLNCGWMIYPAINGWAIFKSVIAARPFTQRRS
jgi:hypothetical protein